jgi:hypothetical protein
MFLWRAGCRSDTVFLWLAGSAVAPAPCLSRARLWLGHLALARMLESPAVDDQLPTVDDQPPMIGDQLPMIGDRLPTVGDQPPMIGDQPLAIVTDRRRSW